MESTSKERLAQATYRSDVEDARGFLVRGAYICSGRKRHPPSLLSDGSITISLREGHMMIQCEGVEADTSGWVPEEWK